MDRDKTYRGQNTRVVIAGNSWTRGILLRANGKPLCTVWLQDGDVMVKRSGRIKLRHRYHWEVKHTFPGTLALRVALAQELLMDAYGKDAAEMAEAFARQHMLNIPVSKWQFTLPEIFAEILELKERQTLTFTCRD